MNLETAEIKARVVEKYRRSKYAHRAKARMQEISAIVSLNAFHVLCYKKSEFKKKLILLNKLTHPTYVNEV